jgi:hypothetical protein
MKYSHDSLLPIGAFKPKGSVVCGRSMSVHGGDSWYAEPSPDESFRSAYDYALQMAAKGYPKILENLKASGEIEKYEARQAEKAHLEQTYGNLRFGTGFGEALGYEYGLKNAYGDLYQKYDAQGNLTEYLDKKGNWVDTSILKPMGFEGFDDNGRPIVGYQHPEYGTYFSNADKYAPMMSPFREDQGGFLGEGGWKNMGMLALTGLTAGLGAAASGAGVAGSATAGGTAAGANALENAARISQMLAGGSNAANTTASLASLMSSPAFQIATNVADIGSKAYGFMKDKGIQDPRIAERLYQDQFSSDTFVGDGSFDSSNFGVPSQALGSAINYSGTRQRGGGLGGLSGSFDVDGKEKRDKDKDGKEAVNLLSQMAVTNVKTPPVAEIDYMYDISGDSVFATPKQESLMPSPFEQTPEAVQGAAPRYQYYDPSGGYLYADGGMVAFEEGGDVTQEELDAALRPVTYNQNLAAYGEQRRGQRPEKEISADEAMFAEIAAGFHPVIGPALSAKDFEEARGENNYLGMGLAGLGMIPVLGGAIKGYNRLVKPALQRRAAQRADAEMVERYGKIPAGEPVPEGYFGGPPVNKDRVSLLDTADQVNYYSSPKFQTQYGKEFTHDLVHGSPSSEVMAFNPRVAGAPDAIARESSSYFNPLLTARRSADDTTTFLSPDAMYSDQYLPTIASNAPTGYGFPIPKKEYKEGATMYPVSARLGKLFDPESKDALNVAEEFLGTIQRPKDMSAKDFDRNISDLKKLLKNGDPKVIESPDFSNFLKERGYDSFAFIKKGKGEQVKNYGVFEPSRIRGKFAEFNPEFANSPEIMKAEGGLIGYDDMQTINDLYEILRSK